MEKGTGVRTWRRGRGRQSHQGREEQKGERDMPGTHENRERELGW